MGAFLGIDTSNYTTSAAVFDNISKSIIQRKQLLPVREGELGLRQSDAVFHHTVSLPELLESLFEEYKGSLSAVGVSVTPRDIEGSYMPCFLVGANSARCISAVGRVPLHAFSHQAGHIAAALYSAKRLDLIDKKFLAFHVSGGTTDALLVSPSNDKVFSIEQIASSLDLKAGQAVDRVGVMLGFPFPCGAAVDSLARKSSRVYQVHLSLKDGCCSLSGVENKCRDMFNAGESKEDICRFCIDYIMQALKMMVFYVTEKYGELPLLFSGGVSSNSILRESFEKQFGAAFAEPVFSSDNAAGIAILAGIKESEK
jgi:N6-L-threonylcarbamoyladenine synthase